MMRIAAALVLCAATICCVRGAVNPDGRVRRTLDQTLPRLGDLVPGGLGILNQDCKYIIARAVSAAVQVS